MAMRVLIFSTAYFPHVGGAEVAVKEITDRLATVDFDMLTVRLDPHDAAEEMVGRVRVYRLGSGRGRLDKLLFPFRAARLAHQLHLQHAYDATWSIMASFSGFAARLFKRQHPDVPYVLTLQEGDDLRSIEQKARLVWPWFRDIFQRADQVTCISSYLQSWAKRMGVQVTIAVIPNGVNKMPRKAGSRHYHKAEAGQNAERSNAELKKQLGISDDAKIVLTTSRLVDKNGIDILLRAFAELCILHSSFCILHLIICGSGPDKEQLKKLAEELNIADRVTWAGFVAPEDLPAYYGIADVFCRPSRSEGLGNSFLEAMAAGVPVVATPVGGIVDFLHDGETGWLAKPEDAKSVAEQLRHVLSESNASEVARVTARAQKLVEEQYTWDSVAEKMKHVFKNVYQG